jgi:transposase
MKRENSHYSLEFKLRAVELSNQRGSLLNVARELNINKETLRNWKKAFNAGKLDINTSKTAPKSKEEDELIRLRKELYNVTMERDILKKAVGIFSKNDR